MSATTRQGMSRAVDPRLFMPWSEAASRDRLSSTLFIAGLLHGVILLGVTFTNDVLPPDESATSFDVVLVTNQVQEQTAPSDARMLAQANMIGAGNTQTEMQLQTALNQVQPADALGIEQSGDRQRRRPKPSPLSERPTIVAQSISSRIAAPMERDDQDFNEQQQARSFVGEAQAIEIINKPEPETLISDTERRELIISANTREARIAAYLSGWKTRIERVGTLNFPQTTGSKGLTRYPTLEVAIGSDGSLDEVIIRNSSGIAALDQAAMNIVNISAPFEPFPEFLRAEYDVLRFAYEWRFTDGWISTRLSGGETR